MIFKDHRKPLTGIEAGNTHESDCCSTPLITPMVVGVDWNNE